MPKYDFKGREAAAVAYIRRVTNGGYPDTEIRSVLTSARNQAGFAVQMSMPKGCKDVHVTAVSEGNEFQYEVILR